ncbi:MAG: hypothetical protein FWB90_03955 [Fibromonadales bacterium]|nr:hypothetical protein [Fibromonadales bacterium]
MKVIQKKIEACDFIIDLLDEEHETVSAKFDAAQEQIVELLSNAACPSLDVNLSDEEWNERVRINDLIAEQRKDLRKSANEYLSEMLIIGKLRRKVYKMKTELEVL